jgi:hypothetical protein
MLKESVINEFRSINKEYDIVGVIRTMFPNSELLVTLAEEDDDEVQD